MINQYKIQSAILSIGLALFLIIGTTVRSGASSIAFIVFLFSCFYLYKYKNKTIIKLDKLEKIWLYSVILLNIVVLLSSYENASLDLSSIDSLTRFLFAIPVFFLVRRIGIDLQAILMGASIGAILMGIYAYYQTVILGLYSSQGIVDHNYFGQLSLLLTFISFCGFAYYQDTKQLKWLFLLASLIGLYAILTSGSRGVWIAIPAIAILMFKYNVFKVSIFKKNSILIILIVLISTAYFSNAFNVKDRVDDIINETVDYFQSSKVRGSAGLRLEMWRASLIITKNTYGLGSGVDGYAMGVESLIKQGVISPAIRGAHEPHNYYLKILVGQGIFGMILLFLFLFIPIKIFFSNIKHPNKNIKLNAILGIGIIIAYMDFMLSNTTLDVQLMSVFLAFTVFPLLGNSHFLKNNLKHES